MTQFLDLPLEIVQYIINPYIRDRKDLHNLELIIRETYKDFKFHEHPRYDEYFYSNNVLKSRYYIEKEFSLYEEFDKNGKYLVSYLYNKEGHLIVRKNFHNGVFRNYTRYDTPIEYDIITSTHKIIIEEQRYLN